MNKKKTIWGIAIFIFVALILWIAMPYLFPSKNLISKQNYAYVYKGAKVLDLNNFEASTRIDDTESFKIDKLIHTIDELSLKRVREPKAASTYLLSFIATYKDGELKSSTEEVFSITFYKNNVIAFKRKPQYKETYYKIQNEQFDIKKVIEELRKDKFNLDVLHPMIGLQKQTVLDRLDISNAEVKTLGVEEYYTTKIDAETESVIFINGLCTGYSRTFSDVNTVINESNKIIKKFGILYGNKLPSVAETVRLSSLLNNSEGVKSMKVGDSYFEQWSLPRDSEREKILLGTRMNEFNGLNIELNLLKSGSIYVITVRYVANRNK